MIATGLDPLQRTLPDGFVCLRAPAAVGGFALLASPDGRDLLQSLRPQLAVSRHHSAKQNAAAPLAIFF